MFPEKTCSDFDLFMADLPKPSAEPEQKHCQMSRCGVVSLDEPLGGNRPAINGKDEGWLPASGGGRAPREQQMLEANMAATLAVERDISR